MFEVRLHPGNQEKQSHPSAGPQYIHAHAHGIQTLSRANILEKQMESDFVEKGTGEMAFPSCSGGHGHDILWERRELQRAGNRHCPFSPTEY